MTCILQKFDSSTNEWTTFTPTTQLAFVTTGENACRLTVDFTLTDDFWTGAVAPNLNSQRTTYQMRIGVQFSNLLPGPYAVYDDFELVMQHYCYEDYLTLTTKKNDFTQTIYMTD